MIALPRKLGIIALTFIATFPVVQLNARADSADEALARVQALEKEIAAIKKENEALRRVKELREQNSSLVKQTAKSAGNATVRLPTRRDPRQAYAADMPIYPKAVAPVERGQLRVWGEGGAIWSGGDPIYSFFDRTALTGGGPLGTSVPGFFALTPKPGWEAATGFDYRLAASPWHVSGQFRYGEARQSASAAFSDSVIIPDVPPFTITSSDSPRADHKETHWLADMALG